MSLLTTIQKLKTILDTISNSILPVKFEYLETSPSSFPSGNIIFVGGSERVLDTQYNEVTERFIVRLIYPTEERQAAMEKWLTLLDGVSAEFRKSSHQTLDGVAVSFLITDYPQPQVSTDFIQPVIIFDIVVVAKTIKSVTT